MNDLKKGKLLIISGFSGVGKGTVVKTLLEEYPNYKVSVSATTREPRQGEKNGIHYFFKTTKEFENMIDNNQFLEYANYVKHYYGTPKDFVINHLDKGFNVILEIETEGALKVKKEMPEAMMIFILPPSGEILRDRLIGRNTEEPRIIAQRLEKAAQETTVLDNYEYFVVNDKVDNCADNINKIVINNCPKLLNKEGLYKIKNDILKVSKGE